MKYSTRAKVTFFASLPNILLLAVTLLSFILLTRFVLEKNVQTDLIVEAEEIITQHIAFDGDRIIYTEDDSNTTLEQDLLTDRLSAKILNKDTSSIGSFGIFTLTTLTESQLEAITDSAKSACTAKEKVFNHSVIFSESTYSVLFYPITKDSTCIGTVVVASDISSILAMDALLLQLSLIVLAVAIAINLVTGKVIANIVLDPLRILAQKMRTISIDQNSTFVEPPNAPANDELTQLVSTFNTMSERIHEGSAKQKSFIIEASHELKTPIARAITELDIIKMQLQKGTDREPLEEKITNAQNDLRDIAVIIDTLLQATKLKQVELLPSTVNLRQFIDKQLHEIPENIRRTLHLVNAIAEDIPVFVNEAVFSLILRNCLSNAYKYTPTEGNLHIFSKSEGNTVTLVFENTYTLDEPKRNVESHKLGFNIIRNLCEVGGYGFETRIKDHLYSVSILNLPISTTFLKQ